MADLTQNITCAVARVFGQAYTSKWGSAIWGTNVWGTDGNMYLEVGKFLATSGLSVSATVGLGFEKLLATSGIGVASRTDDVNVRDAAGYYYIYPGNLTDGEDQVSTTFTKVSVGTASFSTLGATATTWSTV